MESTLNLQDNSHLMPSTLSVQQEEQANLEESHSKDPIYSGIKEEDDFPFEKMVKKSGYTQKDRQLVMKKKIQKMCDRYFISYFKKDIDRILSKVQKMNQTDNLNKYTMQSAAAVIVHQYPDQIRLKSSKEFCRRNGLNIFSFNRKYKLYYYMFVKDKLCEQYQASYSELTKPTSKVPSKTEKIFSEINNSQQAISVIYDGLFKSRYFQFNRRAVIETIIQHYQQLDRKIIEETQWVKESCMKKYYIFFFILKAMGASVYFKDYKLLVERRAGVILSAKDKQQVQKVFKAYFINKSGKYTIGTIYDFSTEIFC